jgi:hypothetical protein
MFYILGPMHDDLKAKPEAAEGEEQDAKPQEKEDPEERAKTDYENGLIHFGKISIDCKLLSKLYQDTNDLVDKMKASELLSEEKNTRDRKYYKEQFHSLIERFGNMFKPPITTDEEAERDIDCLKLVEDIIPELSVENVESLARLFKIGQGQNVTLPQMNQILRKFHRVRYVK